MTTIHDWMLELCVYCTDEVREPAYRRAKDSGAPERESVAAALAAMFTAVSISRALTAAPGRGGRRTRRAYRRGRARGTDENTPVATP
ncbi:hypothetical protein ABZ208_02215 [Streptomyces sp. NPDC006208]|uniref:hypothetical protein n=1 Tax=Streptomyces sp. NPDC006208 TaxID=3156734 RepID=UPI0033AF5397